MDLHSPLTAPTRHPEDNMSDHAHDSHTGPIKTPAQLLWTSFFAFVAPVFIIIGLVYFVTSGDKPAAGAVNQELATAVRIQRVGTVELRDANRPLQAGDAVYKAQCAACHDAGLAGAPKIGDNAGWAARIATGYDAMLASVINGKGAMGAQAGGAFSEVELARAVVHLVNASGGRLAEPAGEAAAEAPAAEAAPAAETSTAPAMPASGEQEVVVAAAPAAAAPATAVVNGEALYKQACAVCHVAGVAGAPKLGDKAGWASRLGLGLEGLTASVIKGKGAMPPRGGAGGSSDAEIQAAVQFMLDTLK